MKEKAIITVKGLTCASCIAKVEKAVKGVDGVNSVSVNLATEKAMIEYESSKTSLGKIAEAIEDIGYDVIREEISLNEEKERRKAAIEETKKIVIVSSALTLPIVIFSVFMILPEGILNYILLALATPVQFWAGLRFYRGFLLSVKRKTADMNTLIAVGTSAAYLYSLSVTFLPEFFKSSGLGTGTYFDTSAAIITLILVGRFLEARAKGRTSEALQKLIGLQAKTAHLVKGNKIVEVRIEDVKKGDIILVKPGEKIPTDGIVLSGFSAVDESMITGESLPVDKGKNGKVMGSTINKSGSLRVKAEKIGAETALAQIIKLVEEAQSSKAPIQNLVDKVAAVFVPVVILIAVVSFAAWMVFVGNFTIALTAMIAVLIIACPCAMGLATPTAIIAGTGRGAEKGILIKSAEVLETAGKINVVLLDKTGTITKGEPAVTDIISVGMEEKEIVAYAAALESESEHPLAKAVVKKAKEMKVKSLTVSGFKAVPGKAVIGTVKGKKVVVGSELYFKKIPKEAGELQKEGKSVSLVSVNGKVVGMIGFADTIKDSSVEAIKKLREMGKEVIMITGDAPETAAAIAGKVGIERVFSRVLPQDKEKKVRELQKEGKKVAMVGDGINDAPALAAADLGIAIGTGTDVAIESSDITLVSGDLNGVYTALNLSRKTMGIIRQNLFWAFIYNVLGIPIAAGALYFLSSAVSLGFLEPILGKYLLLNPIVASAAMALSSVSVVTNSLRLSKMKV